MERRRFLGEPFVVERVSLEQVQALLRPTTRRRRAPGSHEVRLRSDASPVRGADPKVTPRPQAPPRLGSGRAKMRPPPADRHHRDLHRADV